MKGTNKVALFIVVVLVAWLLYFSASSLFAFTTYSAEDATVDELVVVDRYTPLNQQIDIIRLVTINSNVKVVDGDRFHIEVSSGRGETDQRFSYNTIGNSLIASEFSVGSASKLILSNESLITVHIPKSFGGIISVTTVGADVQIEATRSINSVSVISVTGALDIKAQAIDSLSVTTGTGEVNIDALLTGIADIYTATGDINIGTVESSATYMQLISLSGQVAVRYNQPVETEIVNIFGDIDISFLSGGWEDMVNVQYVAVDDFSGRELEYSGSIRYSLNTVSGEVRIGD